MTEKCPPRQSPLEEYKDLTPSERKWDSYKELSSILISRTPYYCFAAVLIIDESTRRGLGKSNMLILLRKLQAMQPPQNCYIDIVPTGSSDIEIMRIVSSYKAIPVFLLTSDKGLYAKLLPWAILVKSKGTSNADANQDIAIKLIKRIKSMFEPKLGVLFDTKETVVQLNGCTIEAFPSNHLDAYRSLENPKFIFLDEADFFRPSNQQDARDVSERYIAKSNPWIVMVSTPNAPDQLFERIEKEAESTCLYKRLFLDYTYGLGRIYSETEIEAAKQSPSFEREYNLKYLGLIGNVFHTKDIDAAIEKGKQMHLSNASAYTQKSVGLDPSPGSSAFGICITELVDGMINVVFADDFPRADFNQMIETTVRLLEEYDITFDNRSRIFVDGANPSFIRSLKERVEEDTNYEQLIAHLKKAYPSVYDLQFLQESMFIIPVPFAKYHREMLSHAKEMMEYRNGYVAINPKFTKLITSLRTAVEKGDGTLDKEATSHDDLMDAFRLSLQFWH